MNDHGFTTPAKENRAGKAHVSSGPVIMCPSPNSSASYSPYSPVVPAPDSGTGVTHGSLESNAAPVHLTTSLSQRVARDSPPANMLLPSCVAEASTGIPPLQNSDASALNNSMNNKNRKLFCSRDFSLAEKQQHCE